MSSINEIAIDRNFYRKCTEITRRYEKLWGRWTVEAQLFHVISEVCEVGDVLRNKKEKYGKVGTKKFRANLLDEVADIFLTTMATAGFLGIPSDAINTAISKKIIEVEKRVNIMENKKIQDEKG